MSIGDYIKSFPKHQRAGIRKEIADYVGVAESTVKHWGNQIRRPSTRNLSKLQKITGLPISELRPDIFGN